MENKRGQFNILGIGIVLVIIAVIVAFLVWNTKFRYVVLGIGLIVASFFILFKADVKQKVKTPLFLVIMGVGLVLIFASGVLQDVSQTGNYIQAPTFFYYECSPATNPISSTIVPISTGATGWITAPKNTDSWDLIIRQTEVKGAFSTSRKIVYQVCHADGNCDSPQTSGGSTFAVPIVKLSNLLVGDRVFANYQYPNVLGWKDSTGGAEWYQNYKPFILWKVDMFGGGRTEYTSISQGCNFPSSAVGNLIDSVANLKISLQPQSSSSDVSLPFYKTRNFIGTYVPISSSNVNFVTYNSKQGYCLNRQIFAISTVTTNSNTYQIVDSNFNTQLASSVTCCPSETQPNQKCVQSGNSFSWQTIEKAQCSEFKACAGADWQDSVSKTQIRYNCVNSKCVSETRKVDCTLNTDCGGSTPTCDTLLHKCVEQKAGEVVSNGTVSGTLVCDKWYQEKGVKTDYKYNILFFKFGKVETEICKTASWIPLTLVIIVIGSLGAFALYLTKPRRRKR